MGERYNGIVEVRGSIPLGSTRFILPWLLHFFLYALALEAQGY